MQDLQAKLALLSIYASGIWNNKRYIMLSMWIVCILGWLAVSTMPNQYKSSTKVHADTKNILKPLLNGLAVQGDTDEELAVISKTLLSRPNLEAIARQTDMHLQYTTTEEYEAMLKDLAKDIDIKGNRSKVYSITYQHKDPEMAKKIVEATLQKFTDSIAGQARQENNSATSFLTDQIESLKERLVDSETRLADFKRDNQDLLPSRGNNYYQSVANLKELIEDVDFLLREKDAEIASLKMRFSDSESTGESKADAVVPFTVGTQYDERLNDLKSILDQLRIKYTDAHPNIIEIVQNIELLESKRVVEQDRILSQAEKGGITQSVDGENTAIQSLSVRIATLESEKQAITTRKNGLNEQLASLQSQLDLIPRVEAELVALTRDYDVTNESYHNLLARKESAELSKNVDQNTSSVNFIILEPPMKPLLPVGPPRIILYVAIFMLSFAIGVSVSFIASQLNSVVSGTTHLKNIVGKDNVIGTIEHISQKSNKRKQFAKGIIFFITTFALLVVLTGLVVHEKKYDQSPVMWIK